MFKNSHSEKGNALPVIIIILVVALLSVTGYVFVKNYLGKDKNTNNTTTTNTTKENTPDCKNEESILQDGDVFCSSQVGIELKIPSVFVSSLAKADNYDVETSDLDIATRKPFGTSEVVYKSELTGNDNFEFSIAKEPVRNGYLSVGDMLQNTYFTKDTGVLSHVETPTSNYNSATGATTKTGSYKLGAAVKSFDIDGKKVYHGSVGDAGVREEGYVFVINDSLVLIKVSNRAYMGPAESNPSKINADTVFDELDESVKSIKFLK